ncbi:unnamed protein product, partial [Darwinula stevensoni]
MPRTLGDGVMHVSEFSAIVEVNDELPVVDYKSKITSADIEIGKHCSSIIEDGSTLQMGIGAIPDAVMEQLEGHKDLGVHTEMFSNGVIDLVKKGVITNRFKKKHRQKNVTTFAIGSKELYAFINDHPEFEFLESDYVNDAYIIAKNPKVVAINSAIEIDITGQVCADSIGTYQYSGVGGQMDFIRGANLSVGGKPIIALSSTTNKGESKIVPFLKPGAGVVTTRAHVHYVITEYGIAYLFGKNLKQRAYALIDIAHPSHHKKHITLIGAGIMSATLGILLNELNPEFEIEFFERMDQVAAESSDAWNNAGTGHSAFCELNYTSEIDGQIDISKAVKIATQFEMSKSFWAYLVSKRFIENPESFINNIPHISFVWGEENVDFLRRRAHLMQAHPLFSEMRFSNQHDVLLEWMPLVMQSRKPDEVLAATKMDIGTDVNFGNLTRVLFNYLESLPNVTLHLNHELRDLEKIENGQWRLKVKDELNDVKKYIDTDFVFLGAGGGSLPLLDKSDIEEAKGYGGF